LGERLAQGPSPMSTQVGENLTKSSPASCGLDNGGFGLILMASFTLVVLSLVVSGPGDF